MADTEDVLTGLKRHPGTRYPVLVPNLIGFDRALRSGAQEIAVFTAASESFNVRNTNCSIAESINRLEAVTERAKDEGIRIRGYVSCVLGCPYEGHVEAETVADVCKELMRLGCDEISLGDTIGAGTPGQANKLVKTVSSVVPISQLAVHFHDTYGQALANILASLDAGIRIIDSSVSGLGGCPYARGASGNVASEDVVYMLNGLGLETGIDLDALVMTGEWISKQLHRPNNSKAGLALSLSKQAEQEF